MARENDPAALLEMKATKEKAKPTEEGP